MRLLSVIGKIFLGVILFFIFSFLIYWIQMYRDDSISGRYTGIERVQQSLGATGLWFSMGLIGTFTGKLHNPFNFFLSIYGIKNIDFP